MGQGGGVCSELHLLLMHELVLSQVLLQWTQCELLLMLQALVWSGTAGAAPTADALLCLSLRAAAAGA